MINSNSNTANVVNLTTARYRKLVKLQDSIEALSDYASLESEQKLLQIVSQSIREHFLNLQSEILQPDKS
jgi:multidrug efflux pump subunit AcrA (membrane-fusion protein)